MAKSPAYLLTDFLSAQGLGVLPPTVLTSGQYRLRTGRMGDENARQICLYDSGGLPDHPTLRINYPHVQVRVRGDKDDYAGAYSKLNDVKEFLVGLTPQDIEGQRFSGIIMLGGMGDLGYDAEQRPQFSVNLRCFLEPSADSSASMHRESL